jgi:hypothetical protein
VLPLHGAWVTEVIQKYVPPTPGVIIRNCGWRSGVEVPAQSLKYKLGSETSVVSQYIKFEI